MIGERKADNLTMAACLVIDRDQRIVQWSDDAGRLLGFTDDSLTGLNCASAVGGRDSAGELVCRADCPAFEAAQNGRRGEVTPMTADCAGTEMSLTCSVVALTGQAGNALVTLAGEAPDFSSSAVANGLSLMGGVNGLAASSSSDMVGPDVQHTLDWLRQTLDVEAAELFLREPGSDDMLLSCVRSPFEDAFTEINRFHAGEGFPGIVLSRGTALRTSDLQADERYLRNRVKTEGFSSYVCLPLRGTDSIIGTLNIAARRSDLDLDHAQRVLEWASVPLAASLESAFLKARLAAVPQPVPNNSDGELETISRHLLQQMMGVGNATAGELIVHNTNLRGTLHRVAIGGIEKALCKDFQGTVNLECPALIDEHSISLHGRRTEWPSPCQHMAGASSVTHCVPVVADDEYVGLARLQYRGIVPSPPTNHLALLQAIAAQAAPSVRQARDTVLKNAIVDITPKLADRMNGRSESSRNGNTTQGDHEEPFLDIRCFGSFELYRDGRLLPPDAVQRRGALVLLKILLINDGRPVSRDVLSEALWPGADPGVTANRLYVLIHALRRAIEPSSHNHKRRWTIICNDGDRYYINPDAPYRCDIIEFRRAVESGERRERLGDRRGAVDHYNVALDLYTGDLFEDEPYAEWCWAERENLRETVLDATVKVASQYDQWGAPDQSIAYFQRALRIDPLREQIHRRLMEALLAAGRRSEAQRQYSICAELLRKELGIEPMPETKRLQLMMIAAPR